MYFRIGVNLGDVMVKDEDLLGDGVNVAARLESIAETGGICISSSVYDQIAGKLNLGFVDTGQQSLKNITKPVHVYRVSGSMTSAPVRPPRFRRLVKATAFAGLIVVALAVAWQLGRHAPTTGHQEQASLKTSTDADAKQVAEEQRIKKERARVVAEAAQVEKERHTSEELAKSRADAQAVVRAAEQARARAEVEAIKRQAQAELAAATKARQDAEAKAAKESVATVVISSKSTLASSTITASPFDGQWTVTRSCEAFKDRPAFVDRFPATVSNGELHLERRQRGQPGYQDLRGKPAADGSLILTGIFTPGVPKYAGQEAAAYFEGALDGERFILKGKYGKRECSLVITRDDTLGNLE